jgi:uncharacterized Zn finger protein
MSNERRKKFSHQQPATKEDREKQEHIKKIREDLLSFPKSWWGQKWIESILEYGRPFRMERGLKYAQEDRIENLTVNPGQIFAMVQGTAPTPYRVKVNFEVIPPEVWHQIIEKIGQKTRYLIQLLENKMPSDFEGIFKESGYPLFLPPNRELDATCSCPDQAVPCKHIAATVLYVARVLDFDPFILLKLRGKTKDEMLVELQGARSCSHRPIAQATKTIREQIIKTTVAFDVPNLAPNYLPSTHFLQGTPYEIGFQRPGLGASIETLDSLGIAPNLHDEKSFEQAFREIYYSVTKQISKLAMELENK